MTRQLAPFITKVLRLSNLNLTFLTKISESVRVYKEGGSPLAFSLGFAPVPICGYAYCLFVNHVKTALRTPLVIDTSFVVKLTYIACGRSTVVVSSRDDCDFPLET